MQAGACAEFLPGLPGGPLRTTGGPCTRRRHSRSGSVGQGVRGGMGVPWDGAGVVPAGRWGRGGMGGARPGVRGYLLGVASGPYESGRRPVDEVAAPPSGPGGEAWAPARAGAPQSPVPRGRARAEGAQQQQHGRHVGPETAPARSGRLGGACAVEAAGASCPAPGCTLDRAAVP